MPHHAPENKSEKHVLTPEEEEEKVRQTVANDLKTWQEKFARAANKGADDLEERVKEIAERQIEKQVEGVGKSHLVELEDTIKKQLDHLKSKVISTIESVPEDADADERAKAEDQINGLIKEAGVAIKTKAQALRTWKTNCKEETLSRVSEAAESTLTVIDGIRDLGLQEVGMKWTWMDGITYKDWSKYHELRKTFDGWREEVFDVARQHSTVARANEAADEVESQGMALAEDAAKELARLKGVSKSKLDARDATDDFSGERFQSVVGKAEQIVMVRVGEAGDAVKGASDSVKSYASAATERVQEAAASASSLVAKGSDSASEVVVGNAKSQGENAEEVTSSVVSQASKASSKVSATVGEKAEDYASAASEASESASSTAADMSASASSVAAESSSTATKAPKKVWGGAAAQRVDERKMHFDIVDDDDRAAFSDGVQSMVKKAGDNLSDMTRAVQEALLATPTTQGSVESATSVANEQYSRALAAASSVLYGTQQGVGESAVSTASKRYADAVSA